MTTGNAVLKVAPLPNVRFCNQHPEVSDTHAEVLKGLSQKQKQLNPKYFYDTLGSQLFEEITRQPEYYPTRTERALLETYASEIAELCGQNSVLIEPGSGSSEKVKLLLEALRPRAYVPMDIAAEFLHEAAISLGEVFPWLDIRAICADFSQVRTAFSDIPTGKRVFFYPGSTLGNMTPPQAQVFLETMCQAAGRDGGLILGVDLHKDTATLDAAYNDKQAITARFNLNALTHLNRIMGANFNLDNFSHRAFYNEEQRRIEMHLVSKLDHIVSLGGKAIAFNQGETIHTENSYKYDLDSLTQLVERAGFEIKQTWIDSQKLFSVHYLQVRSS